MTKLDWRPTKTENRKHSELEKKCDITITELEIDRHQLRREFQHVDELDHAVIVQFSEVAQSRYLNMR